MLKRIFIQVACLFALSVAISCSKDVKEEIVPTTLSIDKSLISIKADGGTISFNVTSNTEWTAKCDSLWISPREYKGNNNTLVTLFVSKNTENSERECIIVITTTDKKCTQVINVSQKGQEKQSSLSLSNDIVQFEKNGGEYWIYVEASDDWSYSSSVQWISLSKEMESVDNYLVITTDTNNSNQKREGTVTVKCGNTQSQIKVIQQNFNIEIFTDKNYFECGRSSSTCNLTINTNIPWVASCDDSWITIPKIDVSEGVTDFSIQIKENNTGKARSSLIYFNNESYGFCWKIEAYQSNEDIAINVDNTYFEIDKNGGTIEINISAKEKCIIESTKEWITCSSSSLQNGGKITVSISPNNSEPRTGKVIITNENKTKSTEVTISQKGANSSIENLTLDKDTIFFDKNGGSATVVVSSPSNWSANLPSWLRDTPQNKDRKASISGGQGNTTITFYCDANSGSYQKKGDVMFVTTDGYIAFLTVIQDISTNTDDIIIDIDQINSKSGGGNFQISIETSTQWYIQNNCSWITVSPQSGKGNNIISIMIAENSSSNETSMTLSSRPRE